MRTFYCVAASLYTRECIYYPGMTCGSGCIVILWVLCCWGLQCRCDCELCIRAENGNSDSVVFGLIVNISKFRDGLYVLVEDGDADVFRDFFLNIYKSLFNGM